MLSKPLIQFSVDEWSCVPSLLVIRGQGEVPGHSQAGLGQSLVGSLLWDLVHTRLCLRPPRVCFSSAV